MQLSQMTVDAIQERANFGNLNTIQTTDDTYVRTYVRMNAMYPFYNTSTTVPVQVTYFDLIRPLFFLVIFNLDIGVKQSHNDVKLRKGPNNNLLRSSNAVNIYSYVGKL